jgi:hypothetical protein
MTSDMGDGKKKTETYEQKKDEFGNIVEEKKEVKEEEEDD